MREEASAPKLTGHRHLWAAQRYTISGLQRLSRETAFRHEVLAFVLSLAFFGVIGAPWQSHLLLVVVFLFVCALEAINTAIEEIIDRISPELSSTGRHAKDLGSFAVFCGLAAWGILLGCNLVIWIGGI